MARVVADNLKLCPCCAIAAANADVSGCEDGQGHIPHALSARMEEGHLVVGESFVIGAYDCYGCDEVVYGEGYEASIIR